MQGAFLTPDTQYQNGKNLLCQGGAFHWIFHEKALVALGFHFDIEKSEGTDKSTLYVFDYLLAPQPQVPQ